ncbi:MAG: serine--tRNA ligase [Candidatus Latescibacteria bacterium]|nr:serine--tRNA ligase [Candidatus Latescibacterota bacterium]
MLDIRFIRENADLVKEGARKKHIEVDIDRLLTVDDQRRKLLHESENLKAEKNAASQEIAKLKGDEKGQAIVRMKGVTEKIKDLEARLTEVVDEFNALMLRVPNPPDEEVPEGDDDRDNVEIRRGGILPEFDFEPRDHVELGELLDIIDIPRGVKLAGSRSYILKSEGVLLEYAVLMYALETMVKLGFTPMIVPHLVKDIAMIGTAYFPGGEEQAYTCERDSLYLIGTAEVPVTSYHYDEILDEKDLPLHYCGISPCYRREAGTYGKDTKGLYRIHQFQKVEQVIVCAADPKISAEKHEFITNNSENLVKALELPYRVVLVCGGDLGQPQKRKYDIECWMPSRGNYGETHSSSKFYDFQARRLKLRYRDSEGNVQFCHTLNNTFVATPRILISILECNQQKDGSVVIPEALRKFMGGIEVIEPKK